MSKAMSLGSELKKSREQVSLPQRRTEPLWAGPCEEGPQGGVTQSLLARYPVCKERFRIHVMEGLRPVDRFLHRLEYGSMWHLCEEAHAAGRMWVDALRLHAEQLCKRYPLQQDEIDHWYRVCKTQFPIYVEWWKNHPGVKARKPLLQEQVFDVPYELPSGRIVRLRGKWDSVDLIGKGIWLVENKTKGEIDEQQLVRQLTFDLQTMFYLIALVESQVEGSPLTAHQIAGVIYNVVLRPLSGGKGSIVQKKGRGKDKNGAETRDEFYVRLGELIRTAVSNEWGVAKDQHYFFRRWEVQVSPQDIETFRRQCLDPVLENLCDDYEWWKFCWESKKSVEVPLWGDWSHKMRASYFPQHSPRHFRLPYGLWNPILEGRSSELDDYLDSGSEIGLQRATELFSELAS